MCAIVFHRCILPNKVELKSDFSYAFYCDIEHYNYMKRTPNECTTFCLLIFDIEISNLMCFSLDFSECMKSIIDIVLVFPNTCESTINKAIPCQLISNQYIWEAWFFLDSTIIITYFNDRTNRAEVHMY